MSIKKKFQTEKPSCKVTFSIPKEIYKQKLAFWGELFSCKIHDSICQIQFWVSTRSYDAPKYLMKDSESQLVTADGSNGAIFDN